MTEPQPSLDIDVTRRSYDRLSRVYDLLADASEHASREAGLQRLAAAPGEHLLEVGFGTGSALVDLARAVGSDGQVRGLDLSPGMLGVAEQRLAKESLADRVQLALGDARSLPFENHSFDGIFSSFTLELFEPDDLLQVLAEIRRTLRPEGRLVVVSLYDLEGRHPAISFYKWLHRHFPHFIDCRPIPLDSCLRQGSFEVESMSLDSLWGLSVAIAAARLEGQDQDPTFHSPTARKS